MRVSIEYYRTRASDDAHAVVGRVSCDAIDADAAVAMARTLHRTLDMPQTPDEMCISDASGNQIFRGALD